MQVRAARTEELQASELSRVRSLLDGAWAEDPEAFTDDDWEHTIGGVHFILEEDGEIVSHASVVERELHTGDHRLRTGYVEAVATAPPRRERGYASAVMRAAGRHIDERYELGALGTELVDFYSRLGWLVWSGPTFVRTPTGLVRTEEEDGGILVRLTPRSPELDLAAAISCEWRPGDAGSRGRDASARRRISLW